jgi:UDP-N-acetylglucosamine acyltransferase
MPEIHQFAVIDSQAELAEDVVVGPFCVVGPGVKIGSGTILENNVTICANVTIGENNHFHPGVVIGGEPQDLSYKGTETQTIIGDNNVLREGVTVNRASEKEDGITSLGDDCYIMACGHVAHDCKVGNHVVMANATLLGGHVHVHDHANLSGGVAVHHFTTIGSYSFVCGLSRVIHDVPPYMLADGSPARPRCINIVSLKRNNFKREQISALADAHRLMYRAKVGMEHARQILRANTQLLPCVDDLLNFVQIQQDGRHGRGRDSRRAA